MVFVSWGERKGFVVGRVRVVVAVVGVVVLGASAGLASSVFTDVDEGRYYSDAVEWAYNNGCLLYTSPSPRDLP